MRISRKHQKVFSEMTLLLRVDLQHVHAAELVLSSPVNFGLVSNSNPSEFLESRLSQINELQELGCFEIVDNSEAQNHRIRRHCFVDKVKSDGTRKSRLCVASFADKDCGLFIPAPTVKRISIRLMVSISASYGFQSSTRDVKKAFIMSKTCLRKPVYMHLSRN